MLVTLHESCKVVLTFQWVAKSYSVTIQTKATELLIMLYNLVLSFKSVDEILKCDHSNESY